MSIATFFNQNTGTVDYVVSGQNNLSADDAATATQIAALNASGGLTPSRLIFKGKVKLSSTHNITVPCIVEGMPGHELISVRTDPNNFTQLKFGTDQRPWTQIPAPSAISSLAVGASKMTSASLSLASQDWVIVNAENDLVGITEHSADFKYRPMELHQISRAEIAASPTNVYLFSDFIDDAMTTSPKVFKPTMVNGITVKNLVMTHEIGTLPNYYWLDFYCCWNVTVDGVRFKYPSAAGLALRSCGHFRVLNSKWEDLYKFNEWTSGQDPDKVQVYGMVVANCNGGVVSNNVFRNVRHCFTTGGYDRTINWTQGEVVAIGDYRHNSNTGNGYQSTTAGTTGATMPVHTSGTASDGGVTWQYLGGSGAGVYNYGSTKNILVSNNVFYGSGYQDIVTPFGYHGSALVDTHTLGRRITIENNTFTVPNEAVSFAVTNRSRDTVIRGNTINTNGATKPITTYGPNCMIENNTINGGWFCSVEDNGRNPDVDNVSWKGNTFRNMIGPGIRILTGTGHDIDSNTFINCGSSSTSSYPRAPIYIVSLTNSSSKVTITNNKLNKYTNEYAVGLGPTLTASQITYANNEAGGYAGSAFGLRVPFWQTGKAFTSGTHCHYGGREYRSGGGTTGVTPPTHSSGAVSDGGVTWTYERDIPILDIIALENTYSGRNAGLGCPANQFIAHGLDDSDIFSPVTVTGARLDDTATGQMIAGVIVDIITEDYLSVACVGTKIQFPTSKIAQSYSVGGDGHLLYWDDSANGYKASKPGDSDADLGAVIYVTAVSGTTVTGVILGQAGAGGSSSINEAFQSLTVAATVTYNAALGRNAKVATLGSGATISNITNTTDGMSGTLLIQGGPNSPTWGSNWDFGAWGTPTITNDTTKMDAITWLVKASKIVASHAQGFANA